MVSFRKICLAVLFLWLCVAIILNVLGLNLYFPLNIAVTPEEEFYRLNAVRFAVACLLALIFFRYLFEFRPLPSLVIVFWYAVFFFIGSIIYAIKLDIDTNKLYFLIGVVVFGILIQLEIRQKKRTGLAFLRRFSRTTSGKATKNDEHRDIRGLLSKYYFFLLSFLFSLFRPPIFCIESESSVKHRKKLLKSI